MSKVCNCQPLTLTVSFSDSVGDFLPLERVDDHNVRLTTDVQPAVCISCPDGIHVSLCL